MDKRGRVAIRQAFRVEVPFYRYTGQWQPEPMTPPPLFYSQDGPGWNDIDEAIRWARRQAPVVYVRIGEGASEHFNAGERDGRQATERWPSVPRRRAANRNPDYGGVACVTEEPLCFVPQDEFGACWFDDDGGPLESTGFSDVKAAVDWGHERATLVFVAAADPSSRRSDVRPAYVVSSAGDIDPTVAPMPRARPRRGVSESRWEYHLHRAAYALEAGLLSQRLQEALANDPVALAASCTASRQPPRSYGIPGPFFEYTDATRAEYRAVMDRPPGARDWVCIVIAVAAPTRRQAHTIAVQALHRALSATGEQATAWEGDKRLAIAE